ncbi:MAG: phosphotransferase [Sheuella sp.]|nr:phosphotransferase [Sheuella sp.]
MKDANHAEGQFDLSVLAEWMKSQGIIDQAQLDAKALTGGQSNPTFLLSSGKQKLVLRKKPPGALLPSAHAVDREYRVMNALQGSDVPVPKLFAFSDDSSIVGTPFYLMEFLEGRVIVDQSLPGMTRTERTATYMEMNRIIAALHQVNPEAVGLGDFGRAGNYFGRQIARWSRQYQESRTEDIEALNALIEWLPQNIPQGDQTTIVHGDYRLDNLVFHPTEPRAIGLLDWELATLGHPLADFAYHCMSWHIPASLWRGIGGLDLAELGIPSEEKYVKQYSTISGFSGIEHWDFYIAYNLFRMAAILQGIARRAVDGTAASADAIETGNKARPLAEIGWKYAQRYEASKR